MGQAHDSCVVCLEQISDRAIASPCNHCSFDFLCLVSWINQRAVCPLCMLVANTVRFHPLFTHAFVGNETVKSIDYDWRSPHDYQTYEIPATKSVAKPTHQQQNNEIHYGLWRRRRVFPPRSRAVFETDLALERRKFVYIHNLYSLHVGSNRISQYQDVTPSSFASNKALQSRARAWIRRELGAFVFLRASSTPDTDRRAGRGNGDLGGRRIRNAEFLLEYIIAILKTIDLRGSAGQAEEMLQEFLGREHTKLFLHELNAWLRSPYTKLEDWDRMVQYQKRLPTSTRPQNG